LGLALELIRDGTFPAFPGRQRRQHTLSHGRFASRYPMSW
jgi:hypothetical protein